MLKWKRVCHTLEAFYFCQSGHFVFAAYTSAEQVIYKQKFTLPQVAKGKVHTVVVKQNNLPSIHKDTELSNLNVKAK